MKSKKQTIQHVAAAIIAAAATTNRAESASAPARYDPEVEARRGDYDKLAEALAHMTEMRVSRPGGWLDVNGEDDDDKDHLIEAVSNHIWALWRLMDWRNARTLRKFYVEMRLYCDQLARDSERFRDQATAKAFQIAERMADEKSA